jgi:DNA modification methylase
MKIEDIKPNPDNPRHIKDDRFKKLCESIKKFPKMMELRPMVVDNDGVILGGNMRFNALKKLGYTEIPDEWVKRAEGLTEEEKKQFIIKDNMPFGEWNFDELANQFEVDDLLEWGFDEKDLKIEMPVEEDDVPDVPEEAKSKLGEIYQLGNHRLMCGDATNIEDVEKLMDGQKADMYLTDPPYNVNYEGKTKEKLKIENDQMGNDDFRAFLRDAFATADTVMKQGAVFYIWHADSEGYNFRGACFDVAWKVRQCLIWVKNTIVMGRQDYHWQHEPCLYGWKDGSSHLWASDRKQSTILNFDKPSRNGEHPTMKPVALFDYQIKNNTKKEDIVLDLFGGSGTTLIACEQNGRTARIMELDPHYCDVIITRWENFTGKQAEKINE